jgi:pilus assembly protein CpaE
MNGPISFIVLTSSSDSFAELRGALLASGRARLLAGGDLTEHACAQVARLSPSAVIIELSSQPEQSLALISRINDGCPSMVIISASRSASPDLILRSLRAGAREFLRLPIIGEELTTVLDRTAEFCAEQNRGTRKRGRTAAVFSNKGGCGTSFIATNVAAAAAGPTALVDLNLQSGNLDLFLGMDSKFSIVDLIRNRARLDAALLKSYLAPHSARLALLPAPHEAGAADDIEPEQVFDALEALRERYDYVVMDLPHTFDSITLAALDQADDILLVLTLDIPSIRSAQRALAIFDKLGYPRQKVHIIVNRMTKQVDLDLQKVERVLGERVAGVVQNDFRMVVNSINLGTPLVEAQPSSAIAADIRRIIPKIFSTPEAAEPEPRKGLLGSLFRRPSAAASPIDLRAAADKA